MKISDGHGSPRPDPEATPESESTSEALIRALTAIAEHESKFTERFYEILFERRPDTRELFGAYPLVEQGEMMRETLHALATLADQGNALDASSHAIETVDGPGWLVENLRALGVSHAEYGVTPDMYDSYRVAMSDCTREVVGDQLDGAAEAALDIAVARACDTMNPTLPSLPAPKEEAALRSES